MEDGVYYAVTDESYSIIPESHNWEYDKANAEDMAIADAENNNKVYEVYEITVRRIARTRITVEMERV